QPGDDLSVEFRSLDQPPCQWWNAEADIGRLVGGGWHDRRRDEPPLEVTQSVLDQAPQLVDVAEGLYRQVGPHSGEEHALAVDVPAVMRYREKAVIGRFSVDDEHQSREAGASRTLELKLRIRCLWPVANQGAVAPTVDTDVHVSAEHFLLTHCG